MFPAKFVECILRVLFEPIWNLLLSNHYEIWISFETSF